VILPPEILDGVLQHIPADREGGPTLIACALVATWWAGPSQRRLFSSVSVLDKNSQRWMNGVVHSRSKIRLLRYVRSLLLERRGYPLENFPGDFRDSLPALRNLRTLSLGYITIEDMDGEAIHTCFSAFRETLTELSFGLVVTSFSTFVTLVGYFPNVTTLRLGSFTLTPDEGPVSPLPRPLRGKISIHDIHYHCQELVNRLAKLDLEYDELVIEPFSEMEAVVLESLLQLSARTVKRLRLKADFPYGTVASISHFRQLRELELLLNWSNFGHLSLLSSIASSKLRKIVFKGGGICNIFTQGIDMWTSIDEQLCELVERLDMAGCCHTLEVELRPSDIGDGHRKYEIDFAKVLPRFRNKGIVTITDRILDDLGFHFSPLLPYT